MNNKYYRELAKKRQKRRVLIANTVPIFPVILLSCFTIFHSFVQGIVIIPIMGLFYYFLIRRSLIRGALNVPGRTRFDFKEITEGCNYRYYWFLHIFSIFIYYLLCLAICWSSVTLNKI